MLAGNEFWIEPRANKRDAPATQRQTAPKFPHPTSKACALGLIGLAIAVALWGFGYKLSRYSHHSDISSRASIAKLWDKHQDSTHVVKALLKLTPPSHLTFEWNTNFALLQGAPELQHTEPGDSDESDLIAPWARTLVPLRSPPSQTFQA